MRSHGALLLARVEATQIAIANVCGVSQQAVHVWIGGDAKPTKAKRSILSETYGIPPASWDEKPPSAAPVPRGDAPPRTSQTVTPDELAARICAQANETLAKLEGPSDATGFERVRQLEKLAGIVDRLKPKEARRLTKSPEWIALSARILDALVHYPEAHEAVMIAIETEEDA